MIHKFECGIVATNCYVVTLVDRGQIFVVDAPQGATEHATTIVRESGCKVTDILLTHTHWDHTADCAKLQRETGARVWVHPNDAYRLVDPMHHTVWPLPFEIEPVTEFELLDFDHTRETKIRLGREIDGYELKVLFTPGHTEGGVCYVDDNTLSVFVGDTLFSGSVGRTDLPGGDMDTLIASIRNELFALPRDYAIYPGHGAITIIDRERRTNIYVGDDVV